MGALYWLPEEYAVNYLAKHARTAERCARRLGPLETKEDAVRWARLAFLTYIVEPILATLLIIRHGVEPWMVWIDKTGMIAQIVLHAKSPDRGKETALFLPLLEHTDFRVRQGAIMLLGKVGTKAAIPPLVNMMHGGGGESFAAFCSLCGIGDESVLPLLEKEAERARFCRSVYSRRILALKERLGHMG